MENPNRAENTRSNDIGWKKLNPKKTTQKIGPKWQSKFEEWPTELTHSLNPNNLSFWVTLTLLAIAATILYADHQQSKYMPDRHYTPNRMVITDSSITETQSPIFNTPYK